MKFVLGIFYVNRLDLLYKALNSIPQYWSQTVVIDNSWERELRSVSDFPEGVTIYEPPVPLAHSQTQNLLHQWGAQQDCDVIMYMHSDAEALPETPSILLSQIEALIQQDVKWGAAHTYFDTIAVFNMKAVREVGPWDPNLPMYFSDIDWYRRMRLCGYELIQTGLTVIHHNDGASTVKSNAYLTYIHMITFPLHELYYRAKWGGAMNVESYVQPFNQFPLRPIDNYLKP